MYFAEKGKVRLMNVKIEVVEEHEGSLRRAVWSTWMTRIVRWLAATAFPRIPFLTPPLPEELARVLRSPWLPPQAVTFHKLQGDPQGVIS